MAFSRYNKRSVLTNSEEIYKKFLEKKGIKNISHYNTPIFYLDDSLPQYDFKFHEVYWKDGDRLYKLSKEYYNSVNFWWVIGFFNQKPTDLHFQPGDLVLIPYPLEEFLSFIGVY